MTVSEEIDLIIRAKAGDLAAFEALYTMHKAAIYRTAVAITNGLPIYTVNPSDFSGIEGLDVVAIPHPQTAR